MLKTPITPEIIEYCTLHGARESSVASELREKSLAFANSQMLITPLQGALLKLLVQITNAKNILEIGMFAGYSSLWLASGLPQDGKLTTLDINARHLALAQEHWHKCSLNDKITPIIAPAIESLTKLKDSGALFDLIFIDANKGQYLDYYNMAIDLVRNGGLVIIDNVLMYGYVIEENPPKKNYIKILKELNKLIKDDPRVDICMLPIGDGLTIARKKDNT